MPRRDEERLPGSEMSSRPPDRERRRCSPSLQRTVDVMPRQPRCSAHRTAHVSATRCRGGRGSHCRRGMQAHHRRQSAAGRENNISVSSIHIKLRHERRALHPSLPSLPSPLLTLGVSEATDCPPRPASSASHPCNESIATLAPWFADCLTASSHGHVSSRASRHCV